TMPASASSEEVSMSRITILGAMRSDDSCLVSSATSMFIERRFHSPDLRRKGLFGRTRLQVSAVVELENLEKSYRLGKVTVNALRGVTLKLWQAEFMVIMGPSGSGKTTLLNIIG